MKLDFSRGKTNVFLVFLGLAIITSFTSKLLSTYEKNIDFTVLPSDLPNDKVLTGQSSEKISLKLIISAGIREVFYESDFNKGDKVLVRDAFIQDGLVSLTKIKLSQETAKRASLFLLNHTLTAREKLENTQTFQTL